MYAIRPQYFRSPLVRAVFCEDVIKRRSVTSRYHGGKISRSQQFFLTETAISVVERWKKSLGYCFAPSAIMHRKVILVNVVPVFAGPRFVEVQILCFHVNVM